MGAQSRWGVIFDAGSSGTRVYIYRWKEASQAIHDATLQDVGSLPRLKLEKSHKIRPGVSSFADRPADIGPNHLRSLIDVALSEIPSPKVSDTPVFLMATAGMRLLDANKQQSILSEICSYLRQKTQFYLPDCTSHVQVIPGETEGLYGWIAANYLLGGFDHPDANDHGKGHHTYGFLDMGGASAQVAFAPNSTEIAKHKDDLKLVRLRKLDGLAQEYKVFTMSLLGFGANTARERYVEKLRDQYDSSTDSELPDPCMPKNLRTSPTGDFSPPDSTIEGPVLVGTGRFTECVSQTFPLLVEEGICEGRPCLFKGRHVPAIDFDVNHFVGVSEFWHTTHGFFSVDSSQAYDLATYLKSVNRFCSRDWDSIQAEIQPREKGPVEKAKDAAEACFKASWLINVLYDGIGIPRFGSDVLAAHRMNISRATAAKLQKHGFADAFQPIDKIEGVEVSWTLGKMVLYAAGQIPPRGSALPVGFGSNERGIPVDFEYAGSSPLSPPSGDYLGENELEPTMKARSNTTLNVLGLSMIVLLVFLLFSVKRDRKRWLCQLLRPASRRWWHVRRGRSFSLPTQLFGRRSAAYERVLEEGTCCLDLADVDLDKSDGSESSCKGLSAGRVVPGLNIDRSDTLRPGSAMDRNGLVVRTESSERLSPSIQMLNAGRRSRAASPTRIKSPLTAPLRGS